MPRSHEALGHHHKLNRHLLQRRVGPQGDRSVIIEKLDGPKGDPILDVDCNVIGTYEGVAVSGDLTDGCWARVTVTDDAGAIVSVSEHRWFSPVAPSPPPPLSWNAYEFKARFTQAERIAIRNAAKVSDALYDFQDMLDTAGASQVPIVANNAELVAGLQALVDATILTADRRNEILGSA